MSRAIVTSAIVVLVSCAGGGAGTEPQAVPPSTSPASVAPDPNLLWGRSFISSTVTEGGSPRPLVDGTEIGVRFESRDPVGVVSWVSCNYRGSDVQITPNRLDVLTASLYRLEETDIGCRGEREQQDNWLAEFFLTDPFWELDGRDLTLRSGDIVIELEEGSAGYW